MKTLVTGAAGFIGYHVAARLIEQGAEVMGIDSLNTYYDPRLKRARLDRLLARPGFEFAQIDIADRGAMEALFARHRFERVIHLAAQAGVRYSIENPHVYAEANLTGLLHVLEGARLARTQHLIDASSSSVYGGNTKVPFAVADRVDAPVSLCAATKRANELMAHCSSHLFSLPTTGLRFFTVYGPWGRPDMARSGSRRPSSRGGASMFTTTAACCAIVPTSMTLPRAWCASRRASRQGTACSTSETATRWNCWTSSRLSKTRSASGCASVSCRCRPATR